jgi:hypothetical protein
MGASALDGLLKLGKCRFYIIYWTFDANGTGRMMSKAALKNPSLVLMEGDTNSLETITQLDLNNVFKTLGIHKTISRNQSVQIEEMKKKSDNYARGILSVNVTNFKAWTGLFTI